MKGTFQGANRGMALRGLGVHSFDPLMGSATAVHEVLIMRCYLET